jgi:hypothetical protein
MHYAPDDVATVRIDVRPNRVPLKTCRLNERDVVTREREHHVVTASLERTAKSDVRIQVAEGPEGCYDELQTGGDRKQEAGSRTTRLK